MIANAGKILVGAVVGGVLLVGVLDNIKGSLNSDVIKDNTLAKAYMEKSKEQYATCYYSINGSVGAISDVSFSYYYPGMSDEEKTKIKQVEDGFVQSVKDQCEDPVNKYEENYEIYKRSSDQIIAADRSLFDNRINAKPVKDRYITEYEPAYVRFMNGNPFDNYIFTDEDIKQYFTDGLGY